MSTETPRRSTRLSEKGSAKSVYTNATNTRNARTRISAPNRPRLNVQGSSAYGATGNPAIGSNQPASGDFAAVFGRQREQALERDEPITPAAVVRAPSKSRDKRTPAAVNRVPSPSPSQSFSAASSDEESEEESDDESEDERPPPPSSKIMPPPALKPLTRVAQNTTVRATTTTTTVKPRINGAGTTSGTALTGATPVLTATGAQTSTGTTFVESPSKSFGNLREGGILDENNARASAPQTNASRASENTFRHWVSSFSLWDLWVIFPTIVILGAFLSSLGLIPNPSTFFQGGHSLPSLTDDSLSKYLHKELVPRLGSLEHRVDMLDQRHVQFRSALQTIQDKLPQLVAVNYNEADNEYEIPSALWHALKTQMSRDEYEKGFEHWLSQNERYVHAMLESEVQQAMQSKMDKGIEGMTEAALSNKRYVTKEAVMELINQNYGDFHDQVTATVLKDVRKELQRVNRDAKSVAISTVNDQFRQLPLRQLEALASANLVRNAERALDRVNFLSPAYAPYVLPTHTSQTYTKHQPWLARAYLSLLWVPGPRQPASALEPWAEPDDCWCAAPSTTLGKAQIGVHTRHRIFPDSFTLEHYPKAGILDASAAPKDLEFWVHIEDAGDREVVRSARVAILGDDAECAPLPLGSEHAEWVCVGRGTYDVDAPNHVQTFDLDVSLKGLGVAVHRVMLRVASNYGREWTCLYRLMLHGELENPALMDV